MNLEENFIITEPVKYVQGELYILDQTALPSEEKYIKIEKKEELYDAIYKLKVRGAPAIGVAAAYGLYVSAKNFVESNPDISSKEFLKKIHEIGTYIEKARPTAVNLKWAIDRMKLTIAEPAHIESNEKNGIAAQLEMLEKEAIKIHSEDLKACRKMGEYGMELLKNSESILTHCNAGTLATSKYGTCLAPIYIGKEQGINFKVFADETRPLLQGARLTAWELSRAGVDVTLICDNMAATVMAGGKVDAVVVGCDRMAANGDGANKIGTSVLAILAKEYHIPFYMFVPTSTIDLETATGADIVIEERAEEEIWKMWYEKPMSVENIKCFNPAFDVTLNKYITAVITERGIIYPPYKENLAELFKKDNIDND